MAGDFERINTSDIEAVAGELERLNTQLEQEVAECQKVIKNLKGSWSGEAAEATESVFTAFSNAYKEGDHELIASYAKFLRQGVATGWTNTETQNTQLGNSFK